MRRGGSPPKSLAPLTRIECLQNVLTPTASSQFSVVALWGHPILEVKMAVST